MFRDFCACSPTLLHCLVYVIGISVKYTEEVNQKKNIPAGVRVII